jgi:dihydroorotate dehydrogenase (NAD+) catalytic subunit
VSLPRIQVEVSNLGEESEQTDNRGFFVDGYDLTTSVGKLTLQNPVMPASGTFGYAIEFAPFIDLNSLGAIIVKCITLKPLMGNYPHRLAEVASGTVFSIGLQNVGVDRFIKEKMPFLRQLRPPIIVNIGGETVEQFAKLAHRLSTVDGIVALEVNVSCPNVKKGGMRFGVDPEATYQAVKAVRQETDLTIITKLTPNVTDIAVLATAAVSGGADALSLINAPSAMAIDIETRKPKLGSNVAGGLTGPAIKPIAIRMVWQVAQAVNVSIIGAGGISGAEDALEFIIAGASAVQIGTYNLVDPTILTKTAEGIKAYMVRKEIKRFKDLIKSLEIPLT